MDINLNINNGWQQPYRSMNEKLNSIDEKSHHKGLQVKAVNDNNNGTRDQKLKEAADQFVAIFVKQMLKTMRDTVPEKGLIDGGFAEDVFTDMLDGEISKQSVRQGFNYLSRLLYEQLSRQQR
ncbi:rod-binding protein [Halothermothrix orenii]|uniref:Flagellar protein FlgJ N-terminal domain-containing protein n=1 Tax=Halothermothrix orenii (strain H 168 / OCM 544 / DSM 9562) TaxID=373903 RepID=B8CYN4_HALOH|nr:rod-binding protein [Halothermothrix orenii]ACL70403.1 hypothetical protein Hore_16530 [Halothermothrix orenii H 168]